MGSVKFSLRCYHHVLQRFTEPATTNEMPAVLLLFCRKSIRYELSGVSIFHPTERTTLPKYSATCVRPLSLYALWVQKESLHQQSGRGSHVRAFRTFVVLKNYEGAVSRWQSTLCPGRCCTVVVHEVPEIVRLILQYLANMRA
jgi:hypothetical protein